jgi:FAD/FMN-containing dehydrogenase
VRALRVVLANGEVLALRRGDKPPFEFPSIAPPASTKNTAGYYLRTGMDYLDLFIGQEGTLGIVTEAELTLLPAPRDLVYGRCFLRFGRYRAGCGGCVAACGFVADAGIYGRGVDRFASGPVSGDPGRGTRGRLLIEQEVAEGDDTEEAWIERLEASGALLEASWFATSAADRERFRRFRHAVPEAVNDLVRQRNLTKMGSDFAVPIARNREMLAVYREALDREFPGQYVIFGHIGDAHLHANILPANDAEWARAKGLMNDFARRAVEMGGTVSAEHGLGKRKRDFLPIQFSAGEIGAMKQVKARLDPRGLLGRGTLIRGVINRGRVLQPDVRGEAGIVRARWRP